MNDAQRKFHRQGMKLKDLPIMNLSQLLNRAKSDGLKQKAIDQAMDSSDPLQSLLGAVAQYELQHGSPESLEADALAEDMPIGFPGQRYEGAPVWSCAVGFALVASLMSGVFGLFVIRYHGRRFGRSEPLLAADRA